MSHTSGPWHVQDNDGAYCMVRGKPSAGNNGESIAKVWLQDSDYTDTNAHLIAAAPELLEALETLIGNLTVFNQDARLKDFKQNTLNKLERVERIIKKARGES